MEVTRLTIAARGKGSQFFTLNTMDRLDFDTLRQIVGYLSYEMLFRLHATGSKLMRNLKYTHETIKITPEELSRVARVMPGVTHCTIFNYVMFDEISTLFPGMLSFCDDTMSVNQTMHHHYNSLPPTLTEISIRNGSILSKVSFFKRFADLKKLEITIEGVQDDTFPASLEILHVRYPTSFQTKSPNVSNLSKLKELHCFVTFDVLELPSSLVDLSVNGLTNGKSLAQQCPKLEKIACRFQCIRELTIPPSLKCFDIRTISHVDDVNIESLRRICAIDGIDVGVELGSGAKEIHSIIRSAKRVHFFYESTSSASFFTEAREMIVAVGRDHEELTCFPSMLRTIRMNISNLDTRNLFNLPNTLEEIKISVKYVRQSRCDMTPKKSLASVEISAYGLGCVMRRDVMKLPESVTKYSNNTAVLDLEKCPLPPNLDSLQIVIEHTFDEWDRLPKTLREFRPVLNDMYIKRRYNLVSGYSWSPGARLMDLGIDRMTDPTGTWYV